MKTFDIVFDCKWTIGYRMSQTPSSIWCVVVLSLAMKTLLLISPILILHLNYVSGKVKHVKGDLCYKICGYLILYVCCIAYVLLIQCHCTCDNPGDLSILNSPHNGGLRNWRTRGLRQYNVNGYQLPPELQPSGKFI